MRRVLAVTLLTLAATSAPVAAKCAWMNQQPKVLTATVAVPADGGGIVVGTQNVPHELPDTGEAVQKSWGFLTGLDLGQPVITVLAPGLAVYAVQPNMRTTGELTDGTATIAKLTITTTKVAKLAAPKVRAIKHTQSRDRRSATTTTVKLGAPVPADAVAIVLFDSKGTARSWQEVKVGDTLVNAYAQGRCEPVPDGTVVSKARDKVMVAWVDKYGRLSEQSAIVTIGWMP